MYRPEEQQVWFTENQTQNYNEKTEINSQELFSEELRKNVVAPKGRLPTAEV